MSGVLNLEERLYKDAVLGCNNRTCFEDRTKDIRGTFTYFSIDGNNLKYINDNFGHEAGDDLLKAITNAGMKVWNDNFYRHGGDEFAVFILGSQTVEESSNQIKEFKSVLGVEASAHKDFPISASIGFATNIDDESQTLEDIKKLADSMMYEDKAAYKAEHPEYDMRRARLTSETLKEALKNGDFHKAYSELKGNEPEKPKEVHVEVADEADFGDVESEQTGVLVEESTDMVAVEDTEDLACTASAESEYRIEELNNKVQPIAKQAVTEAVKQQNDKLKLEVAEVLDDEVSYRLNKYEKRRRRRDFKEKVGFILKVVVVVVLTLFILGNQSLRLRFALVFKDFGDMVVSMMKGDDTSSNNLVEDLFRDLGDDLNEVNTKTIIQEE
jgi:diguanylate cyclase (GGDEF)-like protein